MAQQFITSYFGGGSHAPDSDIEEVETVITEEEQIDNIVSRVTVCRGNDF